jgi:hypothetical protein
MLKETVKEKRARIKAVVTGFGNEPSYTPLTSGKIESIRGLNYYTMNHSVEDSKKWSLEALSNTHPDLAIALKDVKDTFFINRGFVFRMMNRGFCFTPEQLDDHISFFKELAENQAMMKIDLLKSVKVKPTYINPLMVQLDNLIEDHKLGVNKANKKIIPNLNKKELEEVASFCTRNLTEQKVEPDQYTPEMIRLMNPLYTSVLAQVETVLNSGKAVEKTPSVRKPRKPKVTPITSTVKVATVEKDSQTGVSGIEPKKINGTKTAYIFDTSYKVMRRLVAAEGSTLQVKGKKIVGFDNDKSVLIKLGDINAFFDAAGKRAFTGARIEAALKKLKITKTAPNKTGMLREDQIILAAE